MCGLMTSLVGLALLARGIRFLAADEFHKEKRMRSSATHASVATTPTGMARITERETFTRHGGSDESERARPSRLSPAIQQSDSLVFCLVASSGKEEICAHEE
jgi:hypothetical protein